MLFGTYLLSWNLLGLFSMRIMDTYCSFDVVDDLEVPVPSEENDAVDLELFWEQMEHSLIVRGLIKGML